MTDLPAASKPASRDSPTIVVVGIEDLRFQALLVQPIATPDRRSVVAGTSTLLVKDRVTGQCFLAVTVGDSVGVSPASCGD